MSNTLDAGAVLEIDLGALARNWAEMAAHAESADCAAVVKADGYGLGLERVAQALHAAGARTFFVAQLEEGRRLRERLIKANIYVLNGLSPGHAWNYADARLRPVLGSLEEVAEWSAFCRSQHLPLPAAIHVDTGMNRLGLSLDEARALADQAAPFAGFLPSLLMSHLACADQADNAMNARQLRAFREVRGLFPALPASLANSAGILLGSDYHFDLVRPGIALYGAEAAEDEDALEPVATLTVPVIQVREVPKGQTVGYGAAYRVSRASRIAILGCGYADGYVRAAGSSDRDDGPEAAVSGWAVPVVGRVSMDLIAVDVTDLPPSTVGRGTPVELFGRTIPIDDVARSAGTIGYELLTRLGSRLERHYVEN